MNLKEIIADGAYTVFARMTQENKIKQIESVQYIKQLSNSLEVNIDSWDILKIFGTGRGNSLYLDRREINKRFMERAKQEDVEKITKTDPNVDPAIASMHVELNGNLRNTINQRIQQFERDKQSNLRTANDRARDVQVLLTRANEFEMSIRALRKQEVDFAGQIRQIEEGGFWKYHSFSNHQLIFRSVYDLNIRRIDKAEGSDIRVNLGKYEARLNPVSASIQVFPFENNTVIGSVCHPHVSGNSICWGNGAEQANRFLTSFQYVELMQLLANLLSDYNKDNPYRTLHDFKVEQIYVLAVKLRNEGCNLSAIETLFREQNLEDDYLRFFKANRDPKRRS